MTLTLTNATGTLPAVVGVLYTATNPASVRVSLVNTDGNARAVNLYVNRGTRRRFLSVSLAAGATWPTGNSYGPIILRAGDTLDGDAAAALVVEYVISSVEKS